MTSKVRVRVCLNENWKVEKPMVLDPKAPFPALLKQLGNKMKVKAKRIFTANGLELNEENMDRIV